MDIKKERENLSKEIENLEQKLEQANKDLKELEIKIHILKNKLSKTKIYFKSEKLSESGGHDSHYWLKISVETPMGKFYHEQWDSRKVEWEKELLEYIASNVELFDGENLQNFCVEKSLKYINLFKNQLKIKKEMEQILKGE